MRTTPAQGPNRADGMRFVRVVGCDHAVDLVAEYLAHDLVAAPVLHCLGVDIVDDCLALGFCLYRLYLLNWPMRRAKDEELAYRKGLIEYSNQRRHNPTRHIA